MCRRRSVSGNGMPSGSTMSRRVGPVLGQPGRGQGGRLQRPRRPSHCGRGRRGGGRRGRPAGPPATARTPRPARPPLGHSELHPFVHRRATGVGGGERPAAPGRVVFTTASSVWARCSITSVTDHPGAADGEPRGVIEAGQDPLEAVELGFQVLEDHSSLPSWSRSCGASQSAIGPAGTTRDVRNPRRS